MSAERKHPRMYVMQEHPTSINADDAHRELTEAWDRVFAAEKRAREAEESAQVFALVWVLTLLGAAGIIMIMAVT